MITDDLYAVIKKQLKNAKEPVTCNDILDTNVVRQMDNVDGDDVSNALAALWRRGYLERFSVHKGHGRGPRYSYKVRANSSLDPQHVPADKPVSAEKMDIVQNEDGSVVIKTSKLVINIRTLS